MTEVFEIAITHEYDLGRCPHLYLKPFSVLNTLERKNRFHFKHELGGIRCFCEDDRLVLSEQEELCFWVVFSNTDFLHYTQDEELLLFDKPQLQWVETSATESGYSFKTELLSDDNKEKLIGEGEDFPRGAMGIVAISTSLLSTKTNFKIAFNTQKSYWEYRIQSELKSDEWEFSIEDKESEWEFINASNGGVLEFKSTKAIPYFKSASNRLTLKWKPLNDPYNYQTHKKVLPFPNFRYQETINQELISPVYIKL